MVFTCHLLTGATIISKIQPAPLGFLLAFLSHYILDFLPHSEYSVENIKKKNWRNSFFDFLRIGIDLSLGIILISIFSDRQLLTYAGALSAILPDGLTFLGIIFSNKILRHNDDFHERIHFLKNKKISAFWRIFSQTVIIVLSILLLLSY